MKEKTTCSKINVPMNDGGYEDVIVEVAVKDSDLSISIKPDTIDLSDEMASTITQTFQTIFQESKRLKELLKNYPDTCNEIKNILPYVDIIPTKV